MNSQTCRTAWCAAPESAPIRVAARVVKRMKVTNSPVRMKRSRPTTSRWRASRACRRDGKPMRRRTAARAQAAPTHWLAVVAQAAPAMPSAGTGPRPKISTASSAALSALLPTAIQSGVRMS